MNTFEGKTIILGVPKLFNLDSMIEAELQAVGFTTINISTHTNTFRYKNIFQRIESFFAKNVLGVKEYKLKLNFNLSKERIHKELQKIDQADYILIIRPEVYPFEFLKDVKKKGKKMIGYQWNGLDRFPATYRYIPLFDRFFVFDSRDLAVASVLPITNFYPTTIKMESGLPQSDVFYAGSFVRSRFKALNDIISKCESLGLTVHYHVFAKRKKNMAGSTITTTKTILSYQQNIQYTYTTKILLDIKVAEHDGLSFRVLESVGFEKKLITTNHRVHEYDFYHPDNILIWKDQSLSELEDFIKKPYKKLPPAIKDKYSFKNWIQYALDFPDYTPLSLP
jgi:hypothetical protein